METSEIETQILLNRADMADGFFRFGTSSKLDFERLKKRLGDDYNPDSTVCSYADSAVTYYQVKVPLAYYSPGFFGLKTHATVHGAKKGQGFGRRPK